MSKYNDLYIPTVSCDTWCSDIIRDDLRHIPRSFYSEAQPGAPVILFLSMNPGGGKKGPIEPDGYYEGNNLEKLKKHFEFGRKKFINPKKGFHRKLKKQICKILSMTWEEAINHTVITGLFKCTSNGDGMVSDETVSKCVEKHLKRELFAWKPICIFTLGKGVKDWVDKNPSYFIDYEVGALTHPSFSGVKSKGMTDKDFEDEALFTLKKLSYETQERIKNIKIG